MLQAFSNNIIEQMNEVLKNKKNAVINIVNDNISFYFIREEFKKCKRD